MHTAKALSLTFVALMLLFGTLIFAQPSIVWQKCLGGSDWDRAYSIQQTSDFGFIVAGYSASNDGDVSGWHEGYHFGNPTSDYWVLKLNSSGRIEWQKCLGGSGDDLAESIQQTSDGGFIVAGYTYSNDGDVSGNHGDGDFWVVKLSSSCRIEWQKCLGGSGRDRAYSIQQTSDGGFIVAGYTESNDGDVSGNHGNADYWVVKLNSAGNIEWQKCLGGSDWDRPYSIQQTSDGGFIVAGWTNSNDGDVSGNHGGNDYWIVRLNSSGNIVWRKCLGGSGWDWALSVQQTSDSGYIVTGFTESNDGDVSGNHGGRDYWVVKLNSSGNIVWQKCLGGTGWDVAFSIQQTSDGGFIVAGWSKSNDGDVSGHHGSADSADYWVVKLNTTGRIVWQKCLGGSGEDWAYSVQQTSDGGFIVAGYTFSNDGDVSGKHGLYDNPDYWVVKLSPSGVSENVIVPEQFKLSVFPNPFNSSCTITAPSGAKIKIYDLQGKLISKGIQSFSESQGKRTFIWQPDKTIRSGIYFVKATMEDGRKRIKRMVLVK